MSEEPLVSTGILGVPSAAGASYLSYVNRRGARWLLPMDRISRRGAMFLYRAATRGGQFFRAAMEAGVMAGRVRLDQDMLAELSCMIAGLLDVQDVTLAFYQGNGTALGKVGIAVMDRDGNPLAFAKTGGRAAKDWLDNEASMLGNLSTNPRLVGRVPKLLGKLVVNENPVVVTSLAPTGGAGNRFGREHEDFLNNLNSNAAMMRLADTAWLHEAYSAISDLSRFVSRHWLHRYERSLERLGSVAALVPLRVGIVHRDFAPWNTAKSELGLFVFDWELAREAYPVVFDRLHFDFMTGTFLGHGVSSEAAKRWSGAVALPEVHSGSALVLAYLIDVGIQYHRQNLVLDQPRDDTVLRNVGSLIDGIDEWWSE